MTGAATATLIDDSAQWPDMARLLARAFAQDPAFSFIFADEQRRPGQLARLFALFLKTDARDGFVMTSPCGSVVSLWRAPGKAHVPMTTMLRHGPALLHIFGAFLPRALRLDSAIQAHHPQGRYWYLHVLGCAPESQGRGLGGRLLQAGLDHVAAEGLPCFLETATPANLTFYERLGFGVTQEWAVKGGPRLWSMLRPPA